MSKRNQVQYAKPEDPKFLKLIKQQIGYKEGPTIDAKRQRLEQPADDSDFSDKEDEQPQVVVLKSGDLTAEEAEKEKNRIEAENNQKPADLSERIIFKSKSSKKSKEEEEDKKVEQKDRKKEDKKKAVKATTSKSKLSFAEDEYEEDD